MILTLFEKERIGSNHESFYQYAKEFRLYFINMNSQCRTSGMRVTCAFWKSHWLQCGGRVGERRSLNWGNWLGNYGN